MERRCLRTLNSIPTSYLMPNPVNSMPFETSAHSFIVRIWSDESVAVGERVLQGHIMDAYTKRRAPVEELADILAFMAPHVAAMGVRLSLRTRMIMAVSGFGRRLHPTYSVDPEFLDFDERKNEKE